MNCRRAFVPFRRMKGMANRVRIAPKQSKLTSWSNEYDFSWCSNQIFISAIHQRDYYYTFALLCALCSFPCYMFARVCARLYLIRRKYAVRLLSILSSNVCLQLNLLKCNQTIFLNTNNVFVPIHSFVRSFGRSRGIVSFDFFSKWMRAAAAVTIANDFENSNLLHAARTRSSRAAETDKLKSSAWCFVLTFCSCMHQVSYKT